MTSFIQSRIDGLRSSFDALKAKARIKLAFLPSDQTGFIKYFSHQMADELSGHFARSPFEFVRGDNLNDTDVVIITAHGSDRTADCLELRSANEAVLIAVWLWDNHLSHLANLKTALAADLTFYSHAYSAAYLANPISPLVHHIPACSAQWTRGEAQDFFAQTLNRPRSDKLLVNYVDYEFSWRSSLLKRLRQDAPEAEVLLMPPDDRSRYFQKNPFERFLEWSSYKTSLLLPIDHDLSTRLYDALLAGQVVLVPDMIPDLDRCIPPAVQQQLGIIRLPDLEIATIRHFTRRAVDHFDRDGAPGVRARHEYIKNNHMLVHRVSLMASIIELLAAGKAHPIFSVGERTPPGLYVQDVSG